MKQYSVPVKEYVYRTGHIVVEATSPESALEMVSEGIESSKIQTVDVAWNPSEHNDTFFGVVVVEGVTEV